nr:MAG TPA: hypothetical protein [Caudoviricetes sp.]
MLDMILELIAKKLAAFEKGYSDNWIDLSTTMITNGSTWTAPSNGIMSVHIEPAINSASYIYMKDITSKDWAFKSLTMNGASSAGQITVFKGHEYKIDSKSNLATSSYIKFKGNL